LFHLFPNHREAVVTGLSGLVDDAVALPNLINGRLNLTYDLNLPSVSIEGLYILEALLSGPPGTDMDDIEVNADSSFAGSVTDVFLSFRGSGVALPPRKLSLSNLEVDLGFKNLAFNAEDLMIGGQPTDLSHLAGLVQNLFDSVWTPDTKIVVNELIRCAVNYTLHVS
jgi:hypothetical protein